MYAEYFGLQGQAFSATPDPQAFYENACYREAYATLLYGVLDRKGFIVLTGEVGTGKTTLLRRLMDHLGTAVRFVFFYNTMLTFDEMVDFMSAELELPVEGLSRVAKLTRLNKVLIEGATNGRTVVLLLDEAQHLSPEVLENLRLISNLETATEKLLQIVLVGQPELEATLADPALRQFTQRIALRHRLLPLPPREIEAFIAYRLQRAGRPRQDLFTPNAVRRIAVYSKGVPRLVNILCDGALLLAYGADATQVTRAMVDEVAADLGLRSRGKVTRGDFPVVHGRHLRSRRLARQSRWGTLSLRRHPRARVPARRFRWLTLSLLAAGFLLGSVSVMVPHDSSVAARLADVRRSLETIPSSIGEMVQSIARQWRSTSSAPAIVAQPNAVASPMPVTEPRPVEAASDISPALRQAEPPPWKKARAEAQLGAAREKATETEWRSALPRAATRGAPELSLPERPDLVGARGHVITGPQREAERAREEILPPGATISELISARYDDSISRILDLVVEER